MRRQLGKTLAVAIPLMLVAAAGWATLTPTAGSLPVSMRRAEPAPRHCAGLKLPFVGLSAPSPVAQHLQLFTRVTRVRPAVLEYYSVFGDPFSMARANLAVRAGTVPLLQWLPSHKSLAAIASGSFDGYVRRFATDVRVFKCPILLSFGHEMNGPWWSWGLRHQSPAQYRAAWRHLYRVFAHVHASNAVWVWNPNVTGHNSVKSPVAWWPGAGYVNMTALDGYDWLPGDTFSNVFKPSLAILHRLAPGKPVMIAATADYPGAEMPSRIHNLFHGAAANGLIGVVYFDHHSHHANWRIEGNSAAVAAFRAGVKRLMARYAGPRHI